MAEPNSDTGQDGVEIVLTPIQLAAILQEQTITGWQAAANRFWGAAGVIGGAVEMVASVPLWLAPEPTLTTKVGAGALDYLGADTAWTGLRQVWTGRQQKTFTATVVQNSLHSLGVDSEMAEKLGNNTDIALNIAAMIAAPIALAQSLRAARVSAIENGAITLEDTTNIDLDAEKAFDSRSHVVQEHVGKDMEFLQDRLANPKNKKMQAASTFATQESAETFISQTLKANRQNIEHWAATAQVPSKPYGLPVTRFNSSTGKILVRGATALQDAYGVRVVILKVLDTNKVYFVLTAYPVP